MQPNDLAALVTPSDPRICGDRVAYVQTCIDLEADRYDRHIRLLGASGDRRLTSGPGDGSPRWSPDGRRIAFLRSIDSSPSQVALIAADGGEAEVITAFDLGVEQLEWSPDGSRLAVVAVTWEEDWSNLDDDERARRPRRIGRVPYRFDGRGWLHDRRRRLWLVEPGSEPVCLTPECRQVDAFAWAPDGSRLAFVADQDDQPGLNPGTDVWEVEIASGTVSQAAPRGDWSAVSYRPDGILHLLGNVDPRYPNLLAVYRREANGSLTDLTGHLDRNAGAYGVPARLAWDGDVLVTMLEDPGTVGIIRVEPDATVVPVLEGQRVVSGFDFADGRLVVAASAVTDPGGLFENGDRLTGPASVPGAVQPDHFRVRADDVELDVWVYLPEGVEPVPVLVNIHGGPATQYGFGFFDEFQVYAGAGYAVVAANPRGSAGRGDAFMRAVTGDGWGVVDIADVTAAVEAALERHPRLDRRRMGIMGGSYGGFLTAWITARDHRYRSAVVERALISWSSFAGTSDIAGVFPTDYTGAAYPDGWREWWEMSPLATAHQVRTPTLILHSETDWRCPIEQAEQYFMALLRNGTEAEMLRFPGEGHDLSRGGKPKHRLERFEAILDWHGRHLG